MKNNSTLSLKSKTIISVCCFLIIFIALVVIVSVDNGRLDLGVSNLIVDLDDGAYLTHNTFAFFFEVCGETPIYLLAAFALAILVWYFQKCYKFRPWDNILSIILGVAVIVAFWFYFKTIIGYVMDHYVGFEWDSADGHYPQIGKTDVITIQLLEVALSIVAGLCLIFALKNIKEETLKKLGKWVIAFVIATVISNLLILFIKGPVGRMRYRTMNFYGDAEHNGFTAWFVMNGKRYGPDIDKYLADTHDMYKSFPSGHTCAAGTTYSLIMLPFILSMKKKGPKILCWTCPIIYTGLVAISRIVAGAHYFSDVLFGGTIAFLCNILVYEIFVLKCLHLKAFKRGVGSLDMYDDASKETIE